MIMTVNNNLIYNDLGGKGEFMKNMLVAMMNRKTQEKNHFIVFLLFAIVLLIPDVSRAEWEFQESGVTVKLNDVCFVDEMHGWAVGDSSTIIGTMMGYC